MLDYIIMFKLRLLNKSATKSLMPKGVEQSTLKVGTLTSGKICIRKGGAQ